MLPPRDGWHAVAPSMRAPCRGRRRRTPQAHIGEGLHCPWPVKLLAVAGVVGGLLVVPPKRDNPLHHSQQQEIRADDRRVADQMIASPAEDIRHRFKGWEIVPSQRLLVVNGTPTEVGARAFDLLLALVE